MLVSVLFGLLAVASVFLLLGRWEREALQASLDRLDKHRDGLQDALFEVVEERDAWRERCDAANARRKDVEEANRKLQALRAEELEIAAGEVKKLDELVESLRHEITDLTATLGADGEVIRWYKRFVEQVEGAPRLFAPLLAHRWKLVEKKSPALRKTRKARAA